MKKYNITVNGTTYAVEVEEAGGAAAPTPAAAARPAAPAPVAAPAPAAKPAAAPAGGGGALTAPMPGTILDIKVSEGAAVTAGQVVLILEAMKMENEISAPADGIVASISVVKGASVNSGDTLMTFN
ncbi:MAG: biotin/lipoyl-containing protein [Bacillota bacterium]|nr:biotin/lipoyl-containing protein [Bacillota bacterium]